MAPGADGPRELAREQPGPAAQVEGALAGPRREGGHHDPPLLDDVVGAVDLLDRPGGLLVELEHLAHRGPPRPAVPRAPAAAPAAPGQQLAGAHRGAHDARPRCAGSPATTGGRTSSSGTNLSPRLETPPPRMTRSGQMSWSIAVEVLVQQRRPLRVGQAPALAGARPRRAARRPCRGSRCARARGSAPARRRRTAPSRSRCRASASAPRPVTPLPAPKRISARPAASASLRTTHGPADRRREGLDRVDADPALVDVGRRHGHPAHDRARAGRCPPAPRRARARR